MLLIPKQLTLKSILLVPEQLNPKPILLILVGASLVVQLAIMETTYNQACSSNNQPLLDKLEFLKGINLDKVQAFKTMPWDEIKGQYNKWLKSSRELFIDILFKDINNDPNLIYIRKINLNCI